MKIIVEELAKIKDAEEFMLSTEYKENRYISFVEFTGQRLAWDSKNFKNNMNKVKEKFKEFIIQGEIKPKDRIRFYFYSKGDFIKFPKGVKYINIKGKVSRYSTDRLHIEIPSELKQFFEEGDEIIITK